VGFIGSLKTCIVVSRPYICTFGGHKTGAGLKAVTSSIRWQAFDSYVLIYLLRTPALQIVHLLIEWKYLVLIFYFQCTPMPFKRV
jgi:hypothetical protein